MTGFIQIIARDCAFQYCRHNLAGICESRKLYDSCEYVKLYNETTAAEEVAPACPDKTDEFEKAIAHIRDEHNKLEAENKAQQKLDELFGKGGLK